MATRLLSTLIIMLFTACISNNTKGFKGETSTKQPEVQKTEHKLSHELLQVILDLPKWQWVYHPEVEGRLPVKLLNNDFVSDTLRLTKFNQSVQIVTKQELEAQKTKGYIEIKELRFRGDTIDFVMEYPAEGAFANGHFIKKNKEWVIDEYTVGEY